MHFSSQMMPKVCQDNEKDLERVLNSIDKAKDNVEIRYLRDFEAVDNLAPAGKGCLHLGYRLRGHRCDQDKKDGKKGGDFSDHVVLLLDYSLHAVSPARDNASGSHSRPWTQSDLSM